MGIAPGSQKAFQIFLDTGLSEEVPGFKGKKDNLALYPQLNFSPTTEANLWALMIIFWSFGICYVLVVVEVIIWEWDVGLLQGVW